MSNHKRLTNILDHSKHIPFTNYDRFVFFSDLHRGNNSWADEFAGNESIYSYALGHYYDAGFTYVEVGDGDELLKFKYLDPIRISHEGVYKMLEKYYAEERLYYIYGNHDNDYRDPTHLSRRPTRLFERSGDIPKTYFNEFKVHEGLVFDHQESGVSLFAIHGHQGDDLFHRFIWINQVLLRLIWRPLQLIGFRDPTSVAQHFYKRQKVEKALKSWSADHKQPMICGHTHKARFPKDGKTPYFNDGSCVHPRWITCIEILNGTIALIRWQIKPNKKGQLVVKRKVLKGPKPISSFAQF